MKYGFQCGNGHGVKALLLLATAGAGAGPVAVAQSAADLAAAGSAAANSSESTEIAEVVVTALRRNESVLNTPAAVSVLTARTIENAGVTRPIDFTQFVPNMSIASAGRAGENFVSIRGLAQARSADSIVAVIVDGVQLASAEELNQELFDIDHVEVLKGPQGALYGRNAIGGAIVVKTKAPAEEFQTSASIGYANANAFKAVGTLNIPLTHGANLRLGVFQKSDDGHFFDATTQRNVDPSNERGGRARLDISAAHLNISLRGNVSRFDGAGINYHAQLGTLDTDDASQPFLSNVIGRDRQEKYGASAVVDYDLGAGHLILTPAYSHVHEPVYGDGFPYAPSADSTQRLEFLVDTKSTELKYESEQNQAFSYIIGGYWADILRRDTTTQGLDTGRGVLDGRGPFPADSLNPTLSIQDDRYNYHVLAGFGQLNWTVSDHFAISGAIRYDDEKRRQINLSPPAFSVYSGQVRQKKFTGIEPKLTLSYKPIAAINIYADYSQGFVSGGFNPAQTRELVVAADPHATVPNEYGKQINKAVEIGVKSSLLDHRLTLNAAAFHSNVRNLQQFQFFPAATLQAINPIDQSKIDGIEFESTLRTAHWTFFTGAGYTNARIAKYPSNTSYAGNKVPSVPEYTLNAGIQYETAIGPNLGGVARLDYQGTGPEWFDIANTPGTRRSRVDLLNGRLNLVHEKWTVSVFSKNIFDRKYNAEAVVIVPTAQAVTPALPRTFGLELKVSY